MQKKLLLSAFTFTALWLAFCSYSAAQAPLYLVNDETTTRRVEFDFTDTQTFSPEALKLRIATVAPGFFQSGWRAGILSALPLFPDPGVYPFSPVELQKDVIRLTNYYERNGFPEPQVGYEVSLDSTKNQAAVVFNITEGRPLLIDSLSVAGPGNRPVVDQLAPELVSEWQAFTAEIDLESGQRLDQFKLVRLQDRTLGWFRDHGYPFANVSAETRIGENEFGADLFIKLFAGPRAHVSDIQLNGAKSVARNVVLRELPFSEGSLYSESDLTEGERQIFGLNLFQLATVNTVTDQPRDSTVDVIVRVREGPPRFINALTGYYSDGGLTGSAQWTHRNFTGGARAFTVSFQAQTGVGAVSPLPEIDYEARVSLRQPYFFNRSLSASIEPFARYRDDVVEKSTQYGITSSLLFEFGPLRSATLSTTLSRRTVGSDSTSLIDPSTLLPGDAFTINRGEFNLSTLLGNVDNPLNPRSGFVIRANASASGLYITDAAFGTLGVTASAFLPLAEDIGLVARGSAGGFFPLGGTDPANQQDYLAVRDELFFAGGTNDVRGWGTNQLGQRFLDFTTVDEDVAFDSTLAPTDYYRDKYSVRFRPVGAEAKVSGSVQLNLPLPLGPQWGARVFVDAGRTFSPAQGLYALYSNATSDFPGLSDLIDQFTNEQQAFRFGTGAGIQYLTPVGFLSLAVGWKINPSYFDVRRASDVFYEADIEDVEPGQADYSLVDESALRRLQFHIGLGQRF